MEASTIDVKVNRGQVVVIAKGRTGRGQSYIKDWRVLAVEKISDPQFKVEMALAVKELLDRGA